MQENTTVGLVRAVMLLPPASAPVALIAYK